MSNEIIQFNEGAIKNELKELVKTSIEDTPKGLLEQEAEALTQEPNMNEQQNEKATEAVHIRERC